MILLKAMNFNNTSYFWDEKTGLTQISPAIVNLQDSAIYNGSPEVAVRMMQDPRGPYKSLMLFSVIISSFPARLFQRILVWIDVYCCNPYHTEGPG